MSARLLILTAAIFAATAFAPVGGGVRQAQAEGSWPQRIVEKAMQQAENAAERAHQAARQAEERAGSAEGEGRGPGEVTLRIEGDPGTEFSGTCFVGDEKHELSGRVAQTFRYELDGRKLECEIHQRSTGTLEVVLFAGNDRIVQLVSSPGATVRLTYSDSVVSSASTSSGSGAQVSVVSSTQVGINSSS